MFTEEFKLAGPICENKKDPDTWTLREDSHVYWWFYHEMEEPTEEQLRYRVTRYAYEYKIRHTKWCAFLLQKFPTKENLDFVARFHDRYGSRGKYFSIIKEMLKADPLLQSHIVLALTYGSKGNRRRANKLARRMAKLALQLAKSGQYEI